jgi:hypothetical protein
MSRVAGRCVLVAGLGILVVAAAAHGQLTGRLDLDLVARRIPTTVSGEIKLDTPSEFTMLEFAIASKLDLTLRTGFIDPSVNAVVNTAGIEHFVFSSPFDFGNLPFFQARLDKCVMVPEIWVAVPFENVTDVNNLPNSVVIPPANPMFVSARTTFSATVAGFDVKHLIMLEDVNFPSPTAGYTPLTYEHADQTFGIGSLTTASWRGSLGWSMNMQLGLGASAANKSIKGYSARGKVTPGTSFLRLGAGGIPLAQISLFGVGLQNVTLGTSFSISTGSTEQFSTTISISGAAWEGTSISMSITLTSAPPTVSGLVLSVTQGPFKMSIALDKLSVTGLSASCGNSLNLGSISGSWSVSASGIERGLTGLAMRLSLAQGVFSTDTSITFSQRGDHFGFASWSNKLNFRFSPAVVSAQVTFSRYGLTRAAVTTSVSF